MKFKFAVAGLLLVVMAAAAFSGSAAPNAQESIWAQTAKLFADGAETSDEYGFSVALDGDALVVGASRETVDNGPQGTGALYVYRLVDGNWVFEAKLVANDAQAGDFLGRSVDISGDTIIGGAHNAEAAYVFTRADGEWMQQAKLTASDGVDGDFFGLRVSLEGDTAVVGACNDDNIRGSAYVFSRSGGVWSEDQKLIGFDTDDFDRFGCAVGISGDTVVIGAHDQDLVIDGSSLVRAGSAYVYTPVDGSWELQQKITADDPTARAEFALNLAIQDDTIIFGSPWAEPGGEAYIFTRADSVWSQQAKLLPPSADILQFGHGVDVDGNRAIVGSRGTPVVVGGETLSAAGSAFIYVLDGPAWVLEQEVIASDPETGQQFGWSAAIDGSNALVGAVGGDADLPEGEVQRSGAAYVFEYGNSMHIQDISMLVRSEHGNSPWKVADAAVTVADSAGQPVADALVEGEFTGDTSGTATGVTDANGQVTLTSPRIKDGVDWVFCVTSITKAGFAYNAVDNVETCDFVGTPPPTATATPSPVPTQTGTGTLLPTGTPTQPPTATATITLSPLPTETPTAALSPTPTSALPVHVEIIVPADGATISGISSTEFYAVAWDPLVGTTNGDGIASVTFELIHEATGTLIMTSTDFLVQYCAFGGDNPCNRWQSPPVNPSWDWNSAPNGTYRLRARAVAADGRVSAWHESVFSVAKPLATATATPTP